MAMTLVTDIDPQYGIETRVSPLVSRVIAQNPGRFTFTGTGTYIVGDDSVAVIDPGPLDRSHVDALLAACAGRTVSHILLTHTHRDHSPAAKQLSEATGAPVLGFGPHPQPSPEVTAAMTPSTWDALFPTPEEIEELLASLPDVDGEDELDHQDEAGDHAVSIDRLLVDGERIMGEGWTLEALHTPGHIANHLCFRLMEEAAVFTGDHIMGWSTSVIPATDGSMTEYMTSLDRLIAVDDDRYYPTHGPEIGVVQRPREFAKGLRDHRRGREAQILEQLRRGDATVVDLVLAMYQATPHILYMAAGQSVLSHLVDLCDRGIVVPHGGPVTADSVFCLANPR